MDRTDLDWNALAEIDPYWAVLTHDEFQGGAAGKLEVFLQSGSEYVGRLWTVIESTLGAPFAPARALDFGCGVGRVTLPLAARCGNVLGLDIAASMLVQARVLAADARVTNVQFAQSEDLQSIADRTFDFVHSFIVFQHIPEARGLRLLERLMDVLEDGGVGAVHVLYYNPDMASMPERFIKRAWRALRRPFRRVPQMQMNTYALNAVCRIIQQAGVRQMHVLPTDHGGCLGVLLCFRKTSNEPYLA